MTSYIRTNAWNNGGTFKNEALLWYAKGVGEMQSLALDNPNSWWFFAAIHGEYVDPSTTWYVTNSANTPVFPDWGFIPGMPQVPTVPLPPYNIKDIFWNQCQHQSWFFTPWHRGYLLALEAQIRTAVIAAGGPSDWALPYWNYFGPGNEYKIPPAFTVPTLPDGKTPNPLFVTARYGPKRDGDIYVVIGPNDANEKCQQDNTYTNSYGGPTTLFQHAGTLSGDLEQNPHNLVHVDVGGIINNTKYGLMSDPGTAALDPIFYLHHSNIDRMWASWNNAKNDNPTDPIWTGGPQASGDREFIMPMPGGKSWVYTSNDVTDLSKLDYTYDDLSLTASPITFGGLTQRLMKLGNAPEAAMAAGEKSMNEDDAELVGAHDGNLRIRTSGVRVKVSLNTDARKRVSASLTAASDAAAPDRVYLHLENVQGEIDATKLKVYVNQQPVGSVALFGLRRASVPDGSHAGHGLSFNLEITDVIDNLFLNNALNAKSLDVKIMPDRPVSDDEKLTVGKISIYRQGQQ